jgi:hypothetical protein
LFEWVFLVDPDFVDHRPDSFFTYRFVGNLKLLKSDDAMKKRHAAILEAEFAFCQRHTAPEK